jgi:hypothetical protein
MITLLYSNEVIETLGDVTFTKGMLLNNGLIKEWEEGGYLWQIMQIPERRVGASMRGFRLFCNGEPAQGGQWHASIKDAEERAHYCAEGSMHAQITYLWSLINDYRQQKIEDQIAMDCALEYIENTNGKGADGTRELLRQRLGL